MSLLSAEHLSVRVRALGSEGFREILSDVSFAVEPGDWLMIVGPNGAGKSTIVNAMSQSIDYSGTISYEGQNLKGIRPAKLARLLGVLSQTHAVSYSFTVREIVRLGRYAYAPTIFSPKPADEEAAVDQALADTGLSDLADHSVLTLSGGELQRVFLAQLFAQNPNILILDEPSNHLDLLYQQQIFDLIGRWLKGETQPVGSRAVISVVHDLSLAKAYGTNALLLHEGIGRGFGTPEEVLTREALEKVYGMDVYAWMQGLLEHWQ